MTRRTLRVALALLLAVMGAEFMVRGPIRFVSHGASRSTDFTAPYLGARALLRGLSPYSSDVFWTMADEVGWGAGRNDNPDDFESRSPYPLSTFAIVTPVAGARWLVARTVTIAVLTALMLLAIVSLASLAGFEGDEATVRRRLFFAFALGLAPIHSALGTGNLVSGAVAMTLLGAWFQARQRHVAAGLCLAIAAGIKPPIAAPVLGYALLRGSWTTLMVAALELAVITGAAALRLHGVPWVSGFLANNALLLSNSGMDVIKWSSAQQQFVNLQYLGFFLSDSVRLVSWTSWLVSGALVAAWMACVVRRRHQPMTLLELSTAVVLSLLPIYHRVYDAALLILPLAWALSQTSVLTRRHRQVTLLCISPFFVPGSTILELQIQAGRIPAAMTDAWWWRAFVLPHQVWALLVMSIALLTAQMREVRTA